MHTLEIIVYGSGGIFAEYFNAIVAAIGSDTFKTLLRMTVLLAGTTAIFSAITRRDFLVCVRWFATYYLVFYIIFIPKVDVEVIDRTAGNRGYHVSNVPLGLGVLAHLTTTVGDALTQLTDKIFSMPDDLRYSKTGMVMASKIVLASRQFQITDSVLSENMRQFVTHCVFWDVLLNRYTLDDLAAAPKVWDFVKEHASPARSCLYNDGSKTQVTVCSKVVEPLGKALLANMANVAAYHGSRVFPSAKNPTEAKNLLMSYLPISYGYLLNTSATATDILQQSVMANAIIDGTLHFGIGANSQTAVASYTAARAQEQQRLTQNTLGFLAGYWLPIMKNAFEAIMYGCFLFVMLLSIFPFGLQILKNYVFTLCWIQAWAPLYAIINLICSYYAQVQSAGNAQQGFILRDLSGLMQANHDMASLAGYLTLSVPFIAAGLVKGMASTMTHVAQYMGGVSQSSGTQAASEAVAGNISMGITGMRNNSSFNTSSYQQDLRGRMSTGMSYQLPGGESINFMPDGSIAVDRGGTLSELGVNANFAGSIHNSAMQQADYSYNTAQSKSVASGEHYASGMRDLYSLSEHVGNSKNSSDGSIYSESAAATSALNEVRDLTQSFADSHDITYGHAKEILSRANAGLGFDGSVSASSPGKGAGGVGMGGNINANIGVAGDIQDVDRAHEQKLYKEGEDFVKRSGYLESVEMATRAVHDHSFHSNNEKGARLLDSAEGHFEKSESLRNEAAINFQKAQGYREVASHAQEDAVNTNVNASNAFLKQISNEHSANGHPKGIMTAVADLRDPKMAKIMVDNFARTYANEQLSNWNKGTSVHLPTSGQEVNQSYQDNTKSFHKEFNQDLLHERYMGNKEQIIDLAKQKNITPEGSVDESVRQKVEGTIAQHKQQIQQAKEQMATTELAKEQKFKEEAAIAKQSRDHGALYTAVQTVASYVPLAGVKTPSDKIKENMDENKR